MPGDIRFSATVADTKSLLLQHISEPISVPSETRKNSTWPGTKIAEPEIIDAPARRPPLDVTPTAAFYS
jgi:hypothetical protein